MILAAQYFYCNLIFGVRHFKFLFETSKRQAKIITVLFLIFPLMDLFIFIYKLQV